MNLLVARRVRAVRTLAASLVLAELTFSCRPPYAHNTAPAASAAPNAVLVASANKPSEPTWGEENAPVTVVEFVDLECPFCERALASITRVQAAYGPKRVRIVWRHFPLPFHKSARSAHEAAAAVYRLAGPQAFFDFTQLALTHRDALNEQSYTEWAERVGIPRERFAAERSAATSAADVDRDMSLGAEQGVNGTPNFFVNGTLVAGAQPFEEFQKVIDLELAEAEKLKASGVPEKELSARRTQANYQAPEKRAPERDEEAEDRTVWQVPVQSDDPVRGPANALVTIVAFSDYECPYCKRVEDVLGEVQRAYPNDVRIVWKDHPLPFHAHAQPAALLARIAYLARGNDAFWQVHDALFEAQSDLGDDTFKGLAQKFKLPYAELEKGKLHARAAAKIEDSTDVAAGVKANGTPHFFINGVRLSGSRPFEEFKKRIEPALETARALQAQGVKAELVYAELMKSATPPAPPETKEVPPADATSPSRGNARAKVVIQEFSDFQCPYCSRVNSTLEGLEKEYGAELKRVFRHNPLPFHKQAGLAAEASLEAFAQRGNTGFWAYHDKLFAAQAEPGGLERENLETMAQSVGLDLARFREALDSHRHADKVKADAEIAEKAGIRGTPGFVINNYFVGGAQSAAVFKRAIRRALADARGKPSVVAQTPSQPSRTK